MEAKEIFNNCIETLDLLIAGKITTKEANRRAKLMKEENKLFKEKLKSVEKELQQAKKNNTILKLTDNEI